MQSLTSTLLSRCARRDDRRSDRAPFVGTTVSPQLFARACRAVAANPSRVPAQKVQAHYGQSASGYLDMSIETSRGPNHDPNPPAKCTAIRVPCERPGPARLKISTQTAAKLQPGCDLPNSSKDTVFFTCPQPFHDAE